MKSKWLNMKKSSFIEGTFIATLAIVIVKILGMLYVIPFYAIVGVSGGSLYAYAYNIYNIFLDISTVGLPIAMSKITNEYNTLKMYDAKARAYHLGINIMRFVSIIVFVILFIFARQFGELIIGDLTGGNTIENVTTAIRFISLAILVIPYLSVTKGYLQGHNIINIPSLGNVLEQIIRIIIVLVGSYVAINVLHENYSVGVNIALLGAFFGGLASYSYIRIKMHKNKEELIPNNVKKDDIKDKEIFKKIVSYAIPFIIINTVSSLYSFVDMLLVLRTMEHVGFDTTTVEFIASSISTWSGKINMIVISIAMGMTISLIPNIVEAYTLKHWKDVNHKINSSLKMILFISLPLAIGLSLLSKQVWSVFYGYSLIGSNILSLSVFVAVTLNLYMVTSSIVQGLNKFKIVYISAISGFLTNMILDVPLMLLFNKIGIPSYLGALVSSITGYLLSVFIALRSLNKEHDIKYKDTISNIFKMLVPIISLIIVVLLLRNIPYDINSKISCILSIIINTIVGGVTYIFVSYKMGLINDILGDKIVKKLTFKR